MIHYYEILGLQPGTSKAEIKEAYRRLCLECHPDKLPPDTPKKARQIVEEHFKQINEAYAYLMEHPSVYEPPRPSSESPRDSDGTASRSIFDPARMEAIRCQLEAERNRIEQQYQQKLERIHTQQQQKLARYGLRSDDLDKMDLSTKLGTGVTCIVLALLGLWVGSIGGILGFLGLLWAGLWVLGLLATLATGTISSSQYQIVCEIKKDTEDAKSRASKQKEEQLQAQASRIRHRVEYFKQLPLATLSDSFIQELSDEDQFFLLLAIKEREDAEQLMRNLETGAKVVGVIGAVLLLSRFFLDLPF